MVNCNSSKPDNEVYYHHIIQQGEHVRFYLFSEYLSNMASQYSSLQFNIFFLIDDSMQYGFKGQRPSVLMKKLHIKNGYETDGMNQREIWDFHLRHPNVNITFMPLSKFMANSPLRFKWRTISLNYLTFYARVSSVWENGGIGMDLDLFNNQYNRHQMPDRRITAILKHYNKGIKLEELAKTLNNIDQDEQNEFYKIFDGLVHQILNETRAFFDRSITFIQKTSSKPVVRTHRNKREVLETKQTIPPNVNENGDILYIKLTNTTNITIVDTPYQNNNYTALTAKNMPASEKLPFEGILKSLLGDSKQENKSGNMFQNIVKKSPERPDVVFLYDISPFSEDIGPVAYPGLTHTSLSYFADDGINSGKINKESFLSLSTEGSFIAALSKQHPFLAHMMAISGSLPRIPPRVAIQNAVKSHCSVIFSDDVYCNNIYVF